MSHGAGTGPSPRYCRNCGAPIRQGSRFCGACGNKIAPVTPEHPQVIPEPVVVSQGTATGNKGRMLLVIGAVGTLLLLMVGGAVALGGLGPGTDLLGRSDPELAPKPASDQEPATEGVEGYLLRSEEEGARVGVLFVRYKPTQPAGSITGYMYFVGPAENPEGAYLETERITGSVEGPRIVIQLESNPQAEYVGTVEDHTMELRNGLVQWTGEAATYEDLGEAAEEMERAAEEGNYEGG
jgi:hypothetical protein